MISTEPKPINTASMLFHMVLCIQLLIKCSFFPRYILTKVKQQKINTITVDSNSRQNRKANYNNSTIDQLQKLQCPITFETNLA